MGYSIDAATLQCLIAAATAILVYWIKASMDKGVHEIHTILNTIHANISANASAKSTLNVNFPVSGRILPHDVMGHSVPDSTPNDEDVR